ncbi:DUF3732 domain-containing protein [Actinoplanes sp. NPDC051411]|uniref:DUF3732 domain-containing protein n=1 Tax=Actinoplanes sp. NPDC051411 TaxID=3155522 RepID=UPI003411F90B
MPNQDEHDHASCPMCGSELSEPDPEVAELQQTLDDLRSQLRAVDTARPRRIAALTELDRLADTARQELRTTESAIDGLRAAKNALDGSRRLAETQAFTKGRIDLYLNRIRRAGDDGQLADLRIRRQLAERAVERLAAELDPDEEREQLTSRLLAIADDMTRWADQLHLEHRGRNVRLDPSRLTVVTDTEAGPAPLFRIGSAENWIGYHLVAHLALHRFFVRQNRPVPHLLMLDQPTQAYYPSEVEQRDGVPSDNDDRAAVRRLLPLAVLRDADGQDTSPRQRLRQPHPVRAGPSSDRPSGSRRRGKPALAGVGPGGLTALIREGRRERDTTDDPCWHKITGAPGGSTG